MGDTIDTLDLAITYFKNELDAFYADSELNQILQISFWHFFKKDRTNLFLDRDEPFSIKNSMLLKELVEQLKTSQPLAQIIGEWEFYGLTFKVNENTLIPRPETEELVQLILDEHNSNREINILDIGTGTGCIPIALKSKLKNANVTAFDISEGAIKIATENAKINQQKVNFELVDILNFEEFDLKVKYDIIVSNPPYIPVEEKQLMHKNVLDFEPELALFVPNEKPLLFYERIADFASKNLSFGGKLYFEINENYGEETVQLLERKSFKNIVLIQDMNDKNRIIKATI